jgi:uncharacterized protein (PEP-CTERM system associated)
MLMATAMVMAMAVKQKPRIEFHRLIVLGASMGCVTFSVFAGDWKVVPTIAINETASDNIFLGSSQTKSGLVSDVTPGISIDGSGGRSKLHLAYQMHNLFYSVDPTANNQVQNSLNAFGTLEAVDNWFFIDASGVISQQSISAFGAAPASSNVNTSINSNITESSTYSISPYFRGSLGSFADYQLRYNLSSTSSKAGDAYNSDVQTWVASLNGKTTLASFGWSLDGTAMSIDQGSLRNKEDRRLRGVLFYQFNPQLQLSLIGGYEENNYQSLEMQSYTNSGAGFSWSPTERTKASFSRENRFFGPSNTFSFSHRTAQTAWSMSSSEDVTTQPGAQQTVSLGTNFNLLSSIYSSAIPDPVARAAFVNALLLATGISPNAELQGGFQTSQTVLQQLRQVSFALLGARNTVTFAATQSNNQNISILNGAGFPVGGGPSQNNVDQLGASINWSHRLTPLSSFIATISRLNSTGTGTNRLETTQQQIGLNFVTQLGPKTNAGLAARRIVADGTTNYSENALIATLSHQF